MKKTRTARITVLMLSMSVLMAGVALAETNIGAGDVGIVGAASTTPATLVRGGSPATVGISITADDGNIPSNTNQCDGTKNSAKTKPSYGLGTGLSLSGDDMTVTFDCRNFSSSTAQTKTLTVSLSASSSAPLGRSEPTVTFGNSSSTAMVRLGEQLLLRPAAADGETAFVSPKLFIDVNPRAVATAPTATAVSSTQINLSWAASDDDADLTSYLVQRAPVTEGVVGTYTTVGTVLRTADPARTYSDTGLSPSTTYAYHVVARYTDTVPRDFESAPSPVTQATTLASAAYTTFIQRPVSPSTSTSSEQLNKIKNGRVVPIKGAVKLGTTVVTDLNLDANTLFQIRVNGAKCTLTDEAPTLVTEFADAGESSAGTRNFRYEDGFWTYNLDTKALGLVTGKCYKVEMLSKAGTADPVLMTNQWVILEVVR